MITAPATADDTLEAMKGIRLAREKDFGGLTVTWTGSHQMWDRYIVTDKGRVLGRLLELFDGSLQVVPGDRKVRWGGQWNRWTLRGALRLLRRNA